MNGILNTPIFLVLFTYVIFCNVKIFLQIKKISHPSIFVYLYNLALLSFVIMELLLIYDFIPYQNALLGAKVSLGLVSLMSLSIVAITVLKPITDKKLRTLWRLPLIGVLAAWYLKPMHVIWMFLGVEVLSLLILWKFKDQFRYSYRQQFKSFLGLIIICFSSFSNLWLFNLGFLLFLILKFQIINAVMLKIVVNQNGKDTNSKELNA